MAYAGNVPFAGLTLRQTKTIENACGIVPVSSHDGVWRQVFDLLGNGAGPFTDAQVYSAITQVVVANGFAIPNPSLVFWFGGDTIPALAGASSFTFGSMPQRMNSPALLAGAGGLSAAVTGGH